MCYDSKCYAIYIFILTIIVNIYSTFSQNKINALLKNNKSIIKIFYDSLVYTPSQFFFFFKERRNINFNQQFLQWFIVIGVIFCLSPV